MSYLTEKISSACIFPGCRKGATIGEEEAEMRVSRSPGSAWPIRKAFENALSSATTARSVAIKSMMAMMAWSELTHETFLKAWSSLPSSVRQPVLVSWLYRIANDCAHTYQKKPRKRQQEILWKSYLEGRKYYP